MRLMKEGFATCLTVNWRQFLAQDIHSTSYCNGLLDSTYTASAVHFPCRLTVDRFEESNEYDTDRKHDDGRHDPGSDASMKIETAATQKEDIKRQIADEDYKETRYAARACE